MASYGSRYIPVQHDNSRSEEKDGEGKQKLQAELFGT